jgi:phosphatidylglycerophosphatase A
LSRIAFLIATWFGCGLFPIAPGTVGALGGLAIAIFVEHHHHWGPLGWGLFALATTPIGIWAADRYSRSLGKKDPGPVVVDEVLGQWLTLAGATRLDTWQVWLAAFLLFRLFDIVKPFPVRRLEAIPGGAGIVIDDLGAGVYGAFTLFVLVRLGIL